MLGHQSSTCLTQAYKDQSSTFLVLQKYGKTKKIRYMVNHETFDTVYMLQSINVFVCTLRVSRFFDPSGQNRRKSSL